MEHRGSFQLLMTLTLLGVLYSQTLALPLLGTYSTMRLGHTLPFDGANEPDQTQDSLKSDTDILQSSLPENDKSYIDASRTMDSNNLPEEHGQAKRHSDAVFTDNYTRFRKQMAVKKYLNSVLAGKRSEEDSANLPEESEMNEPNLSETDEDALIAELLHHFLVSS
ncbi:VIP peptides isoform X2 [Ornithorhynchus anatinus]|uniref:VIP peptides isoform X2 n=1 Tax=Ornithorhynchus anatinus TaxID=9258 RepID=UPI0004548B2B|nr:VIP peptides isoform X2 [Ornithorhynchus anatinus]